MYQAFGGKEEGTEGPMVSFDPNLFPSTNVAAFFQAKLVMQSALAHCFEVPAAPGYIF